MVLRNKRNKHFILSIMSHPYSHVIETFIYEIEIVAELYVVYTSFDCYKIGNRNEQLIE